MEPFRIAVPDDALDDLTGRLARTRWPGQIEGSDWAYGTDQQYLQRLVGYWMSGFDWRAQEAALNQLPQFRAAIDGTGLHFVHQRGNGPAPLALMLLHGWPSSFMEWHKVVGPLADPGAHGGDPADAFDVVVPSLPGYGFSDIPTEPGMTPRRMASLFAGLMDELGYDRFAAHGCDWGAFVAAALGLDHRDRLVGAHMGMVTMRAPGRSADPAADDAEARAHRERRARFRAEEIGYQEIQGTKPQTLAYGLTDSPAGLAGWILEKWRAWADCDGDLEKVITWDELLTNTSIYWFTGTINSSCRLYYESRHHPIQLESGQRVEVPCGFFLQRPGGSRERAERVFNVTSWTVPPRGGHFPALEVPEPFVEDVRAFFRPLR